MSSLRDRALRLLPDPLGRTAEAQRRMSCLDGSRVASIDLRIWRVVGCSLVFGLLVQPIVGLLALMGSANKVPYC